MKKQLQRRVENLEDKLQPQKVHDPISIMSEEWDEMTEAQKFDLEEKHGLVIIRRFVAARDGKPVSKLPD